VITPNYLDLVLWQLNNVLDGGWVVLGPAVMGLFWTMAACYLLWSFIQVGMKTKHPVEIVVASCLAFTKVLLFKAAMNGHQHLMELLLTVMTNIGLAVATAAGMDMTAQQFLSPGTILTLAWGALTPMVNHWNTISGLGILWYAGPFVMYLLTLLCCTIAFFLISLHVFIALASYKILSLLSYPLMALGVFPLTSWLAKSCLDALIAGAVRLGALALICSIILPLIEKLGMPAGTSPDYWSAMSAAAGSILLAFLSWKAPAMAADLVGSRIASAAGDFIAMVTGATYGSARLASGGQKVATQVATQVRESYAQHQSATRMQRMWRRDA
jgi:type IV secretory pathway TrbL component